MTEEDIQLINTFSNKQLTREERLHAAIRMGELKKPAFLPVLTTELTALECDRISATALTTIGLIGHPSALPALYQTQKQVVNKYVLTPGQYNVALGFAIEQCEENSVWWRYVGARKGDAAH